MKPQRPLIIHYKKSQLIWAITILILLIGAAGTAGYFFGDKSSKGSQKYIYELEDAVDELSQSQAAKQSAMTALQLTAQIDADALEQTRLQLVDMQGQIYRREQELKLYREMLQDNTQSTGLNCYRYTY